MMRDDGESPSFSRHGVVCAVVVSFNIGEGILPTLQALIPQVDHLVVVDNRSTDRTVAIVEAFAASHPGHVTVQAHGLNNLAAAQNLGIRIAREKQAEFVLLMDHDSVPGEDMVARLLAAYEECPEKTGLVAPCLLDRASQRKPRYLRRSAGPFFRRSGFGRTRRLDDVLCVIASGSLIPVSTLERVGTMDENLGIDDVDRDFSLRVILSNLRIVAVRDALLHHRIGALKDHEVAGLRVTSSNHPAARRYYIYRNRLTLWRRYGRRLPAFVVFDAIALVYDLIRIALFEEDKSAKLAAAFQGLRDGLGGKSGMSSPFETSLAPAWKGASE